MMKNNFLCIEYLYLNDNHPNKYHMYCLKNLIKINSFFLTISKK